MRKKANQIFIFPALSKNQCLTKIPHLNFMLKYLFPLYDKPRAISQSLSENNNLG